MSLLRQRVARLRPFRPTSRAASITSDASTKGAAYFDSLGGLAPSAKKTPPPPSPNTPSTSPPAPSPNATNTEDQGAPTGTVYSSVNPVQMNQSRAAEILKDRPPTAVYAIHCKSRKLNTIVSATKPDGDIIRTVSAGGLGFKGVNQRSYEAGYQCAVAAFKALETAMEKERDPKWQLFLNGFGHGREAMSKAVTAAEGDVLRRRLIKIIDKTPIKIGGTRAKKQKR